MAKEVKKDAADWKKELARDFIALGSIPFYLLVVARLALPPIDWSYMFQFVFTGIVFILLLLVFRLGLQSLHSGLGVILLILVSLYYNNLFFIIFAIVVYLLLLVSLFYLKKEKSKIWKGIFAGVASAVAGYFIVNWVV